MSRKLGNVTDGECGLFEPDTALASFAPTPELDATVELRVVSISGGSLRLDVRASDCVTDVKARIEDELGELEARQCLIFEGRELGNSQTIYSCGLLAVACPCVYLLVRGKLGSHTGRVIPYDKHGVFVKQLYSNLLAMVEAESFELVSSIKAKIRVNLGILEDQCLIFTGQELCDARTLESYGISSVTGAVLHLHLRDTPVVVAGPMGATGTLLDRLIDGMWFTARVLDGQDGGAATRTVDVQYLDDGKIERDVSLNECRPVGGVGSSMDDL